MPCPHNEITIVQRSQRQSAVAAAAYQSGEKLFCEYDQQVKHYPEKRGIVHNEILLPANALPEYADRNTLWNAAEAVEKQWNSQLARRWVLTIPREIPPDQYAVLVREFCQQQFVSKGMIADFAIHDPHPPGHNPHAHVLLTMRAMDEHGKWLPKSRKVYDLDENGERIKLPSGRWKSHKEDTVDWNDQKYCEIWRHEWEVIQNRYLEANDRPERVDLRSYARQGLDIVPTVHEGAAVQQMEKRGIQTNIGNLNREIKAANRLMQSIRQLIQNLKGWITELGEKRKELLAQKTAEEATLLPNLLMKYMEIRKEERRDWTRAGQNRGTSQDLKAVSEALSYLRQKGLSTVEDLEAFLEASGKSAADLAMYALYIGIFISPIQILVELVEMMQKGLSGFRRFLDVMETESEITDAPDARELTDVKGHVSYEHVSFHYSDDNTPVLSDISIDIPAGKSVALVGPSGGGKTTICSLLPRFYDVTEGRITIDGKDICSLTLKSLRNNIGTVQQDVYLFDGTIRDNIAYGKPGASDEEIIAAAKRASIHDFIMELPQQYDTYVGERGTRLSGGQKQRISIARVFLKNPPILILDEATSALDNESERWIQRSLEELSQNRTTITIAHRLSTIRDADEIIVITEDGIAERGTHEELLDMNGVYAAYYNM